MSEDERKDHATEVLTAKLGDRIPDGGKLIPQDLTVVSWPRVYGSTAGPFGGIGGQMMTTFQLTAYVADQFDIAAVYCGPKLLCVSENFRWEVTCPELDRRR